MSTLTAQEARPELSKARVRGDHPIRSFLRRFSRNRLAVFGAVVIGLMILIALLAPLIAPYGPNAQDYEASLQNESFRHPMGADLSGRDQLSRIIYGARISVQASLYAVGIALLIGVPVGLLTGYYRGFWDEWVVMRIVDTLQAFPFLILALALAATLGGGFGKAMIAIGIGFSPGFIRIVRAQVMTVSGQEFVQAAKSTGVKDFRILTRHILPNSMAPLLVQTTLAMGSAILAEAALSFLGLGVQPPTPSWGKMLAESKDYLNVAPHLAYWPGLGIFLAVLGFNLMGDGVREALDPRIGHR